MTTILSIQSSVAYGHVGNSAATFPLMRSGVEVWPVLTVDEHTNSRLPCSRSVYSSSAPDTAPTLTKATSESRSG